MDKEKKHLPVQVPEKVGSISKPEAPPEADDVEQALSGLKRRVALEEEAARQKGRELAQVEASRADLEKIETDEAIAKLETEMRGELEYAEPLFENMLSEIKEALEKKWFRKRAIRKILKSVTEKLNDLSWRGNVRLLNYYESTEPENIAGRAKPVLASRSERIKDIVGLEHRWKVGGKSLAEFRGIIPTHYKVYSRFERLVLDDMRLSRDFGEEEKIRLIKRALEEMLRIMSST